MIKKLLMLSLLMLGTSFVNASEDIDGDVGGIKIGETKSIEAIFEDGLKIVATPVKPIVLQAESVQPWTN